MTIKIIDQDFALWAFGDVWQAFLEWEAGPLDLLREWNQLHGNLYYIDEESYVQETMVILKKIYEQVKRRKMDQKMAKVTKQMKVAAKDIKKGDKSSAVKALKGAEKKNVKLTKLDRDVRDPLVKKCKKEMKKKKK